MVSGNRRIHYTKQAIRDSLCKLMQDNENASVSQWTRGGKVSCQQARVLYTARSQEYGTY